MDIYFNKLFLLAYLNNILWLNLMSTIYL